MFVYLRNLNSNTPPEICKRPISDDNSAFCGEIMLLSGGYLTNGLPDGEPKYLLLEEKTAGDGKREISCIRLFPGMVLSSSLEGEEAAIPGTMYEYYLNSDNRCLSVVPGGKDLEALCTTKAYTGIFIVN